MQNIANIAEISTISRKCANNAKYCPILRGSRANGIQQRENVLRICATPRNFVWDLYFQKNKISTFSCLVHVELLRAPPSEYMYITEYPRERTQFNLYTTKNESICHILVGICRPYIIRYIFCDVESFNLKQVYDLNRTFGKLFQKFLLFRRWN